VTTIPTFRNFTNAFATLVACLHIYAQPTLQQVWARHDQFVLSPKAKPMAVDPSCSGLNLSDEQEEQLQKAICLEFGSAGYLFGAAIDCLVNPVPAQ